MGIATELGEQGFKNLFIIHGHSAPSHQRALDQTADYFNETYDGKMVNLMGLNPIILNWFDAPKTLQQQKEEALPYTQAWLKQVACFILFPTLLIAITSKPHHLPATTWKNSLKLVKPLNAMVILVRKG
jgi:hypothetical protein